MKRTVLTFGITAGVLIFAYSMLVLAIMGDFAKMTPKDLTMSYVLGYLRYVLLLLGVTMGMVAYRKNIAGPISYGRAFKVGLLIALVTGVFVGGMEATYIAYNPDFYDQYARLMVESKKAEGAGEAELEKVRQEQADYQWMATPGMTGIFYFFETAVIGTIISLIAARFARRKEGDSLPGGGETIAGQPA